MLFLSKTGVLVIALCFLAWGPGCRSSAPDSRTDAEYGVALTNVHRQMIADAETQVDRKIAQAVEQLGKTLQPSYRARKGDGERRPMGLMEISDVNRRIVTRFHQYLTEKVLTFTFLEPEIAQHIALVERFAVNDVWRSASPPPHEIEQEVRIQTQGQVNRSWHQKISEQYVPYRVIHPDEARRLGRRYNVDLVATGVTTVFADVVDLNLRIVETKNGRVVAVGSAKIPRTQNVNRRLQDIGEPRSMDPPLIPEIPRYRFPNHTR